MFKNRTIDIVVLVFCLSYDCVDVIGKAYFVKDFCIRNGKVIFENGINICDFFYLKNDLLGLLVGRKDYMINIGLN